MRQALRGLESRNAEVVAAHLAAAGGLLDEDPQTALLHAQAARERASRIAVVREAVGVAAYHAGDFAEAGRELKAYRRMSGDESYRAVLADVERAQGRPEGALRLVAEALAAGPDEDETVELRLVEAGARQDLGELPAAALVLESALGGRPTPEQLRAGDSGALRLATAYADLLAARGEQELAHEWFEAIMAADPDDETGVAGRFDDLDDEDDDLGDDDLAGDDLEGDDLEDDDVAGNDLGGDDAVVDLAVGEDVELGDGEVDGDGAAGAADVQAGTPEPTGGEPAADEATAGADDELDDDLDVGPGYDPDEQDVEDEVAELLGEIPVPGFSDGQVVEQPATLPVRPLPASQAGLFSAPDGPDGDTRPEHTPPTD